MIAQLIRFLSLSFETIYRPPTCWLQNHRILFLVISNDLPISAQPPTQRLKSFDRLILWQALHRIGWVETHSHAKHIAVLWKYHLYLSCITLNINKIPTSKEVESAELLSFKDKEQLTSRCAPLSPVVPVEQLADSFIASSGVPYQCTVPVPYQCSKETQKVPGCSFERQKVPYQCSWETTGTRVQYLRDKG